MTVSDRRPLHDRAGRAWPDDRPPDPLGADDTTWKGIYETPSKVG